MTWLLEAAAVIGSCNPGFWTNAKVIGEHPKEVNIKRWGKGFIKSRSREYAPGKPTKDLNIH